MFPQDSHFPPIGRMIMPRPSMCHTSSLQTPIDKEQALQISVSGCIMLTLFLDDQIPTLTCLKMLLATAITQEYPKNIMSPMILLLF